MLSFEEFAAAAAKQVEHVADCRVKKDGNWVRIVVESYLANDDGSVVERWYAHVEMTPWQYGEGRCWATPGPWLLQTFDRAIAEKWQGYTRYATAEEIAAYKSAKEVA